LDLKNLEVSEEILEVQEEVVFNFFLQSSSGPVQEYSTAFDSCTHIITPILKIRGAVRNYGSSERKTQSTYNTFWTNFL